MDTVRLSYPFSRSSVIDACPEYARLREQCPVARVTGPFGAPAWIITRYDDVVVALTDSRFGRAALFAQPPTSAAEAKSRDDSGILLNNDPPEHDRLRRLVSRSAGPRRVALLRESILEVANELADRMSTAPGVVDFNRSFAEPFSQRVLSSFLLHLLAVPAPDRARVRVWAEQLITLSPASASANKAAFRAVQDYLAFLIKQRRSAPGDDPISAALASGGVQPCNDQELTAVLTSVLFGGHSAMVAALGYSLIILLAVPDRWRRFQAAPSRTSQMVEEILRYNPPGDRALTRIALTDVKLSGTAIPAGDAIIPCLASANRDPSQFHAPDAFIIDRRENSHLAFGHGVHVCLGMALARLGLRVALTVLATRLPGLRLAVPVLQLSRIQTGLPVAPVASIPVIP